MTDPSFERYVLMRNHLAQEPFAGGAEDTSDEFVARVHKNVVRVPKNKYTLRKHALDKVREELRQREVEFCALRGAYLFSKHLDDRIAERTKQSLEDVRSLRKRLQELENSKELFLSKRGEGVETPAATDKISLQDSVLKERLRDAKRKGFEKHFLFKTYEECNSSSSKKPFYMSKERLADTVSKYYPELLKNRKSAKSLTKRELCNILFE